MKREKFLALVGLGGLSIALNKSRKSELKTLSLNTNDKARSNQSFDKVNVNIYPDQNLGTISKYLTGMHFVYAYEKDAMFKNGQIADWMRKIKTGTIRWPGGTVVDNYHWDHLTGWPWKDSWAPGYDLKSKPNSQFMDLDEYIAFCRKVGAEPMVGINIKSGWMYDKKNQNEEEARREIQYCVDKNYRVKFWYIGNEEYKHGSAKKYAQRLDKYARILKSVDPNIIIIGDWKFGPAKKHRIESLKELAANSTEIDIIEIHEKWGNQWGLKSGNTWAEWKKEFPIYNGKLGEDMDEFSVWMREAGHPDIQLGFNEWGLGYKNPAIDKFQSALIAADYLIELFSHKVKTACYWNLNIGSPNTRILSIDENNNITFNPIAKIFELYSSALENKLIKSETSIPEVYGFSTKDEEKNLLRTYLINKGDKPYDIYLKIQDYSLKDKTVIINSFRYPGEIFVNKINAYDMENKRIRIDKNSFNEIQIF